MSNNINNGGPAFPIPLNPGQTYTAHATRDGMTLRDYFAAKALQGDAASGDGFLTGPVEIKGHEAWAEKSWQDDIYSKAKLYYQMADAMLRARGEA